MVGIALLAAFEKSIAAAWENRHGRGSGRRGREHPNDERRSGTGHALFGPAGGGTTISGNEIAVIALLRSGTDTIAAEGATDTGHTFTDPPGLTLTGLSAAVSGQAVAIVTLLTGLNQTIGTETPRLGTKRALGTRRRGSQRPASARSTKTGTGDCFCQRQPSGSGTE